MARNGGQKSVAHPLNVAFGSIATIRDFQKLSFAAGAIISEWVVVLRPESVAFSIGMAGCFW